ncbi:hybrid sensor histidine kinase/response regulator [Candidatus Dependentiae bacterium]|nr:hybrid sensor histidine kinase/response regulator [Candidatus Dependentiae bacterium]
MAKKLKKSVVLGFFKEESTERINILNNDLLKLEKDPNDSESFDEILREVHGLKGAARMVGLTKIIELTHEFETLFNVVKEGSLSLSREIIDIGFDVFDSIDDIVDAKLSDNDMKTDPDAILEKIESLLKGKALPEASKLEKPRKPKSVKRGKKTSSKKSPSQAAKPKPSRKSGRKTLKPEKSITLPSEEDPVQVEEISSDEPTPAQPEKKTQAQETLAKKLKHESIRVNIRKIDDLINIMGEVVVNQMLSDTRKGDIKNIQLLTESISSNYKFLLDEYSEQLDTPIVIQLLDNIKNLKLLIASLYKEYNENTSKMALITTELQEGILKIRMLPASTLFDTFPRTIRDIGRSQGKEIEFIIKGAETEVDTNMLEELKDPLIHLLRNSIDHGIELPEKRSELGKPKIGTIILEVYRKGDSIFISVKDDGKGIDPNELKASALRKGIIFAEEAKELTDEEAFNLIFEMGFSTREQVSDISGRGVGMDVVRKTVQNTLKGEIIIHSVPGAGSEFLLKLPLTLTIIWALLVEVSGRVLALPVNAVEQIISFNSTEIVYIKNMEALIIRDEIIPYVRLSEVLKLEKSTTDSGKLFGMILKLGTDRMVFQIDRVLDELQIVIKTLDEPLKGTKTIAGVTILGTGEIVPVLNVPDLISITKKRPHHRQHVIKKDRKQVHHQINILVAEDSFTARQLEQSILEGAGFKVDLSVNGLEAWNKLQRGIYDLVITDIEMPEMDGFELTKKIKSTKETSKIPVIIVTTWDKPEFKTKGLEAGADKYILKSSFNQETLLNTIKYLIEKQD